MEPTRESTARFRRQLLGYDRREVESALASSREELRQARAERDELRATAANLDRVGAEVADMLRALADRAVELEDGAAAAAERTLREARADADAIRAAAAALLAEAERQAEEAVAEARAREAAASRQRQTAVAALRLAMDEIGELARSVEELSIPSVVQVTRSLDLLDPSRAGGLDDEAAQHTAPVARDADVTDLAETEPRHVAWGPPETEPSITLTLPLSDDAAASDRTGGPSGPASAEAGADDPALPDEPARFGSSARPADAATDTGRADDSMAEARARIREWTSSG